ncbi:predicted protein [Naegleria gruberi]|uniref:Predicted protein n=1 Tax=Naegleria gruberi TaxID=5762 RepID=D2VEZ0_NAEGR|nr:uncharacterized protein NAEGRDRAFT_67443 [Naegleria gruberi]EFC44686.1 predicted protein [Naegleria gruberi]|eukprot:XP_002677430.1 predicted protein [Naegleria gruberi strain NEG-M]
MTCTNEVMTNRPILEKNVDSVKYVSEETALGMSRKAFERSAKISFFSNIQELLDDENNSNSIVSSNSNILGQYAQSLSKAIGIGCTGAIRSKTPKKGKHQAFIAVNIMNSEGKVVNKTYHLILEKDRREREEEECLISSLILKLLIENSLPHNIKTIAENQQLISEFENSFNSLLFDSEKISEREWTEDCWDFNMEKPLVGLYTFDGVNTFKLGHSESNSILKDENMNYIIFPGSFNPLHIGHVKLMERAREIALSHMNSYQQAVGLQSLFEISVQNVDKKGIDEMTVTQRLEDMKAVTSNFSCIVTKAPLFNQKVTLFNRETKLFIVIGADTAIRIVDKKYYNNSESEMINALLSFKKENCQFLVGGRLDQKEKQHFLTMEKIQVPSGFQDLFVEIPDFRVDISSSELRANTPPSNTH